MFKAITVLLLFMKQLSLVYGQVILDVEENNSVPFEIEEESFLKTVEFQVRYRISVENLKIVYS